MKKDLFSRLPVGVLKNDKGVERYLRDVSEFIAKRSRAILMGDIKTVFAYGEPQTDVNYFTVPCDGAFASTPTITELLLLGAPAGIGVSLELNYLGFSAVVIPADSNGDILADFEHIDNSESDTVSNHVAGYSFEGKTARIVNDISHSKKTLDPGDVINTEFATDGAISTPSTGAGIIVGHKVAARMAA